MNIDEKYIKKITGFGIKAVKHCASTFDEIGDNDVIIALSQKRGVGRGDHEFFSPPGGIYIVMRERGLGIDPHTLTPIVGLAVHDTVRAALGLKTSLKWVNDVIYNGKKVCGILCRSPRRGEYLIGIGVNYATSEREFEREGLSEAGSLNAPIDKATLFCADLIKRIHVYSLKPFDAARYNSLCETVGKNITFTRDGVKVNGFAAGVESDGTLLVKIGMATVAVDAGEVSIIREDTKKQ